MPSPAGNFRGFTLAETVVTVGLMAVLLTVYSVLSAGSLQLQRSGHGAQAASLVQEALDSLRLLPFSEISVRNEGPLLNVAVSRGGWTVRQDFTDGQVRRLFLPAAEPEILGETGLLLLPANWQDDLTLSAKVRARNGSAGGWGAGLAVRYRDAENHYRFRISAGGLAFDRVRLGVSETLWSQSSPIDLEAWEELEIAAADDQFTLKRGGVALATVTDSELTVGETAVISLNGAVLEADDVALQTGELSLSWDFEDSEPGAYPEEWLRFGWPDLPDGQASLTVTSHGGEPQLKEASVTVAWTEKGSEKSAAGAILLRQ